MDSFSAPLRSEEELPALARRLLDFAGPRKVFLFHGEMGSGKTTLIKAACRELGVQAGLSSPTYSIIHEYAGHGGQKVCHMDLYRLKSLQEGMDIGLEDYLDSGNYCFIEWPEIAAPLYPLEAVNIYIKAEEEGRQIRAEKS